MIRNMMIALVCAGPAFAQEPVVDRELVAGCFASADILDIAPACIGVATNRCIDATPNGSTTAGMVSCTASETAIWDEFLNQTYQDLRAQMREMDASDYVGDMPRAADALRDAQRAWIAFRDAECNFEWAMFQEGSMRSLVASSCIQEHTARRALELRLHMERLI